MSIDINQIRELLSAIAQTDITELTLKHQDFELTVRKGVTGGPASSVPLAPPTYVPAPPSPAPIPLETAPHSLVESPSAPASDPNWVEVTSPMVGTFYRAPAPDDPPFAEVGTRIQNGQTVCIIEAMKLMNEIEAEVSGQVMEILVENGQPVEYGQVLMRVQPN